MRNTKIEWTDATWNPWSGCREVSPGCEHCYARVIAEKFSGKSFPNGFALTLRPHRYKEPLTWKKPMMVFVNSMTDMFFKDVPDSVLRTVWDTMVEADWHTFQILTKRPHRAVYKVRQLGLEMPPHIWLGVSTENQVFLDNRLPPLLETGTSVPWISAEPLLGPLDLGRFAEDLKWVVDGGESGPLRRQASESWFREIRDQCIEHGIPYFHKQGSAAKPGRDRMLDGRTWDEWPTGDGAHTDWSQSPLAV